MHVSVLNQNVKFLNVFLTAKYKILQNLKMENIQNKR